MPLRSIGTTEQTSYHPETLKLKVASTVATLSTKQRRIIRFISTDTLTVDKITAKECSPDTLVTFGLNRDFELCALVSRFFVFTDLNSKQTSSYIHRTLPYEEYPQISFRSWIRTQYTVQHFQGQLHEIEGNFRCPENFVVLYNHMNFHGDVILHYNFYPVL